MGERERNPKIVQNDATEALERKHSFFGGLSPAEPSRNQRSRVVHHVIRQPQTNSDADRDLQDPHCDVLTSIRLTTHRRDTGL